MKLIHSPASPFVRKVRVLAIECGLDRNIELKPVTVSPVNPNPEVARENPLVKVPALVLDDGTALYDSCVICEYLDTLHSGTKYFPSGAMRWTALRQQALCDGVMDSAVLCRMEGALRPPEKQWDAWRSGQLYKISNALAALERETASLAGELTIGGIAAGCALGYLDFRIPELDWRARHPPLAAWFATFAKRPSMQQTVPAG